MNADVGDNMDELTMLRESQSQKPHLSELRVVEKGRMQN